MLWVLGSVVSFAKENYNISCITYRLIYHITATDKPYVCFISLYSRSWTPNNICTRFWSVFFRFVTIFSAVLYMCHGNVLFILLAMAWDVTWHCWTETNMSDANEDMIKPNKLLHTKLSYLFDITFGMEVCIFLSSI